jgi:multicomponent Na+:H+ antiporter subunit A
MLALIPASIVLWLLRQLPLDPAALPSSSWGWVPSVGVELAFRLDGLAATFVLLVAGIGALVLVYAGGYMAQDARVGRLLATILAFMGAMLGVVLADDVVTLFVFWELTSVCSFLLVGFNHEKAVARASALKALLITGAGGLALLAGLILAALAAGEAGIAPVRLSELADLGLQNHPWYPALLMLILAGAVTKSAQVPFHFWLPAAMAAPTPVSAYLHSATMVKAGVFLLARLHPALGGTPLWQWTLGALGMTTMLVAAGMAIGQHDLKKILAYSTLAVLGILTMLLGIGTDLAIKTAVVFLVAHALYKAALFMVAGSIDHETGTRDVTVLRGLRRAMPWTAAAGALAALSKAGAPPMFGFIGKELLYTTKLSLESVGGWVILAAVAANVILVATALMVSVLPFCGQLKETPKRPHEAPWSMRVGPLLLGALGLSVGLAPGWFDATLGSPMASAIAGRPLVLKLALWHGLNIDALKVMALSLLTLAVGWLLYRILQRHLATTSRVVGRLATIGPAQAFERGVDALPTGAAAVTRVVHSGVLRHAILVVVVVAIAAGLPWLVLLRPPLAAELGPTPRLHEILLAALILAGGLAAALLRSRLAGVAALGLSGLAIAVLFALYSAPDLALTQVMVESLSVILLVLVFVRLPRMARRSSATLRVRDAVVALAAGAMMTGLVIATALSLPLDPEVARFFLDSSAPLAYGRNVVNVILVDFRALDTLGEITVVAVAGFGIWALVKGRRTASETGEDP